MFESSSWEEIRGRVLSTIVPKQAEIDTVKNFSRKVVQKLDVGLAEAGVAGVAEVHGSVARGTWLAGDRDFDVFIVLDESYGRQDLPAVLDVIKNILGRAGLRRTPSTPI